MTSRKSVTFLFLLLIAGVLFLDLSQTNFSHMNDEGLYAQIGWEMFDHHDGTVPTWFGHPAYYKPPLTYWLMFPFFKLFGRTLLAARLPSAIVGLFTLWVTYLFGKRLYGEREGLLSAAILLTSSNFIKFSRNAMMESLLMFFFILSTYCFYRASEEDRGKWLWAWLSAVGASCLVKGPISVLILLISAGLFCVFTGRFKFLWKKELWAGIATGGFFMGLWPLLIALRGEWKPWWNFFILGENFGKFQNMYYGTSQIWGSYLISILPWSFIFVAMLLVILIQGVWKERGIALNLIVIATTFAVFLLPATRLTHYTVPVIPSGALLLGSLYSRFSISRIIRGSELITGLVLAFAGVFVILAVRAFSFEHIWFYAVAAGIFLILAGLSLLTSSKRMPRAALFTALSFTAVSAMAGGWNYPLIPAQGRTILSEKPAYVYKDSTYLWSYHIGKEVIALDDPPHLSGALSRGGRVAIAESDLSQSGLQHSQYRILSQWTILKPRLSQEDVLAAIKSGQHRFVEEPMMIIEKSSP